MADQAPDNAPATIGDLRFLFDQLSAVASKLDDLGTQIGAMRRKVDSGVTSDRLDVNCAGNLRTGPFVVCRRHWRSTHKMRKPYGTSTKPTAFQVIHWSFHTFFTV